MWSFTLSVKKKKKTVKSDQFFSGDQYFSPTKTNFDQTLTGILQKMIRFIIP